MNHFKRENRLLNIIIGCEIVIIVSLFVYFLSWGTEFNDPQRARILQYIEEDKLIGMTVDECSELLGEPLLVTEEEAYFEGGYCLQFDIGGSYWEWEVKVYLDENGYISSVRNNCILVISF